MDDFEEIQERLQHFKTESTLLVMEIGFNIYEKGDLKLETVINELTAPSHPLKQDQEVQGKVLSLMQLMTDWKTEIKTFLSKSPLLGSGLD